MSRLRGLQCSARRLDQPLVTLLTDRSVCADTFACYFMRLAPVAVLTLPEGHSEAVSITTSMASGRTKPNTTV